MEYNESLKLADFPAAMARHSRPGVTRFSPFRSFTMQIKSLSVALVIALASAPALAATKTSSKTKASKPAAAPIKLAQAPVVTYPVAGTADRKSTRLNSSHRLTSRMPSSA
jgi:hypothetical protein